MEGTIANAELKKFKKVEVSLEETGYFTIPLSTEKIEAAYSAAINPDTITDRVTDLQLLAKRREKELLSENFSQYLKHLIVDILGGGKREKILSKLAAAISTCRDLSNVRVPIFHYRYHVKPKPGDIFRYVPLEHGDAPDEVVNKAFYGPGEHKVVIGHLVERTDLVDMITAAFGGEDYPLEAILVTEFDSRDSDNPSYDEYTWGGTIYLKYNHKFGF